MIGGTIVSNARLMKPLFYDGNFNRDGKKMRAVFEREISDGTVSYRLWRSDGKPDIQYPRAENDNYWTMPRNLPKGHQFFIGYYQTQRAIRFHVENIHTDQSVFLSTWLLDNGYRVFLHFKSEIVTELKLGDNPPPGGRINSPKNLEGLLLSVCLGKLSE